MDTISYVLAEDGYFMNYVLAEDGRIHDVL